MHTRDDGLPPVPVNFLEEKDDEEYGEGGRYHLDKVNNNNDENVSIFFNMDK